MHWLLGAYMWLYIHRPFEIWPIFAALRLERVFMIATFLVWLMHANKGWVANRFNVAYFGFIAVMLLSWVASPYMQETSPVVIDKLKIAVFVVLALSTVRDEKDLRRLLAAYLFAIGLYMTHSFWEFHNGRHRWRMGIVRMIGVDRNLGDPNAFAATLCYSLLLTLPFWAERPRGLVRWLLAYYTVMTGVCIVYTGSRSGFIGVAVAAVFMASTSRHWKKMLVLLCVAAPAIWIATPEYLQHRYLTIIDPSYGPENAHVSAESRIEGFYEGVALWDERPITGFGPGSFSYAAPMGKPSHNLYGQVLGEVGTIGMIAFIAVLFAFWNNLREVRRIYRTHPSLPKDFLYHLPHAIFLSLLVWLVLGMAGHNLFRYTWMWFGAFQAIGVYCLKKRLTPAAPSMNVQRGKLLP